MIVTDEIKQGLEEIINHTSGKTQLKKTVITIPETRQFTAGEVRQLREQLGYSRAVFAKMLGVSNKTIEAWEFGKSTPCGSSSRLLELWQSVPGTMRCALA